MAQISTATERQVSHRRCIVLSNCLNILEKTWQDYSRRSRSADEPFEDERQQLREQAFTTSDITAMESYTNS